MAEQVPAVPVQKEARRGARFIQRQRRGLHLLLIFGLLVVLGAFFVTPFGWMILTSLKSGGDLFSRPVRILPEEGIYWQA